MSQLCLKCAKVVSKPCHKCVKIVSYVVRSMPLPSHISVVIKSKICQISLLWQWCTVKTKSKACYNCVKKGSQRFNNTSLSSHIIATIMRHIICQKYVIRASQMCQLKRQLHVIEIKMTKKSK